MSRTKKWTRNIGIGIGALLVLVLLTAVIVVRTAWFRNFVKQEIISATESGTGGRAEIGSFDLAGLQVTITDFVIHGNEPAGSPPFVRIGRIEANVRLFTGGRIFDISHIGVDRPEANVMLLADGRTNIPTPKPKPPSNTSGLETVVDLAIRHFEVTNGLLTMESRQQPLNVRGNNLRAQLAYNTAAQGYQGELSLEPLYVLAGRNTPVNFKITLPVELRRDRIDIRKASIATAASMISLDS